MRERLFSFFQSTVYLQCCVSFGCTAKWFNYMYVCLCVCVYKNHFWILSHYRLLQDIAYSSLCYTVTLDPCCLSILNIVECIVHVCMLSHVWLFATPWAIAHQAPLSLEFSRQEYWSGLPFPPPGDLPNPGIELTSLTSPALAGRFFITGAPGKPVVCINHKLQSYPFSYLFPFGNHNCVFMFMCLFLCYK